MTYTSINMEDSPLSPVFSFIHASDIHLGTSQFYNPKLAGDYLHAFQQILQQAEAERVNFIILGGDIFTSRDILPDCFEKVLEMLQNFYFNTNNSISIIAIEGNHDIRRHSHGAKLKARNSWLKVLHRLGLIILLDSYYEEAKFNGFTPYNDDLRSGSTLDLDDVRIYGTRYFSQDDITLINRIAENIPDYEKTGKYHILVQHFGIAGQMKNVPGMPISVVNKLKKKVHYLALGHYHKGYQLDDWIFNPGCPEAVSPIETTFTRGIFSVKVYKQEISGINCSKTVFRHNVKRIRLKNRGFRWIEVNLIYKITNSHQLFDYVRKALMENMGKYNEKSEGVNPTSNESRIFLTLKGYKPKYFSRNQKSLLINKLLSDLGLVDLRIYTKFQKINPNSSLDKFVQVKQRISI